MLILFRTQNVCSNIKRNFLPVLWICGHERLLDPIDGLCSVHKVFVGSRLSARTNP